MGRQRFLARFVAFVLAITGVVAVGGAATAGATTTTVTVNQSSLAPGGYWASPAGSDTGTAGFVAGPATPPQGTGSLALNVPAGQHRAVYDYQYGLCANWPASFPSCTAPLSTPISSISALRYSTYRGAGSAVNAVPSLNLEIDPTGSGAYTSLVWEPSNNGGVLADNVWQTWDAYSGGNGKFWSSAVVAGAFPVSGPGGTQLTWNALVAAMPNAKIKYGVGSTWAPGRPSSATSTP